ncbi:MAG: dihydrodipicolinate synthase family protein [Dethiobacter sp.]|jgi:4-hydroxy-tetrahydrodipicolinate synthase|nr:dihydrodipicolinate synthase family protein [Dethiobacter sp.]
MMPFVAIQELDKFIGVITALLTPFTSNGENIDFQAVRDLVDWQVEQGIHCLFPAGTSGEGMLLSLEERRKLLEVVYDQAGGRIPVIAHAGDITTKGTVELALHAAGLQVDAVSVLTPYYYKVGEKEIADHFIKVANSIPKMPVILYNNPATAGNELTLAVFKKVKEQCQNVVGIKDSSKSITVLKGYKDSLTPGEPLLVGGDGIFKDALEIGAVGAISTISNIFPKAMIKIFRAWSLGNKAELISAQEHVKDLLAILTKVPYYAACKIVLTKLGISGGSVRPPMGSLTVNQEKAVLASLKELNVL